MVIENSLYLFAGSYVKIPELSGGSQIVEKGRNKDCILLVAAVLSSVSMTRY